MKRCRAIVLTWERNFQDDSKAIRVVVELRPRRWLQLVGARLRILLLENSFPWHRREWRHAGTHVRVADTRDGAEVLRALETFPSARRATQLPVAYARRRELP